MPWQKLAMSIEDVVNQSPDFIGAIPFDLHRSTSFILEYHGDETFSPNTSLQNSLTIGQLRGLRLDRHTTARIKGLLQARDIQRTVTRRKNAADRRRKLKSKKGVQGGTSRSSRSSSRH